MCGRYDNLIAREAYRAVFGVERLPRSNFPPRYNVAPTDSIPIVRVDPRDGERELTMARWGLVPWWSREIPKIPHINARMESLHKSRMFRDAFAKRRALIPATGFYEWQRRADGKQPYRFTTADLQPFAFAGLWEFARIGGDDILSATIIVGEPNPLASAIHDRMPVILEPGDYNRWLDPDVPTDELRALLKPDPAERMKASAVNRAVNNVKNDNEECIESIGEPPLEVA
jgi:putative SOS response-associated peptidase YedK